jgi:hypothetical protein
MMFSCLHTGQAYVRFEADEPGRERFPAAFLHSVVEIRRRARVVDNVRDGNSALMLVTVRPRYVAGKKRGTRKHMNIRLLKGGTAIEEGLEA